MKNQDKNNNFDSTSNLIKAFYEKELANNKYKKYDIKVNQFYKKTVEYIYNKAEYFSEKNDTHSMQCYWLAAMFGYGDAAMQLSMIFFEGKLVNKNTHFAKILFISALALDPDDIALKEIFAEIGFFEADELVIGAKFAAFVKNNSQYSNSLTPELIADVRKEANAVLVSEEIDELGIEVSLAGSVESTCCTCLIL